MGFIVKSFVYSHFNSSVLHRCKHTKPQIHSLYETMKLGQVKAYFELVENPHNLRLHLWRFKWHKRAIWVEASLWWVEQRSPFFPQVYLKPGNGVYPHWFQRPVTVEKNLEMYCQERQTGDTDTEKTEIRFVVKKELRSQYLICLPRWFYYQWPSGVGFHCKTRYNQHPWKQCCLQGQNVQLDNGSKNSHE